MRTISILLLTTAAIAISGCQTMNSMTGGVFSSSSPSREETSTPEPAPATVASTQPTAPIAAKNGFAGVTSDALRSAWGEPSLKRNESGAEMWQYAGSSCTLLVYLYPGSGAGLTVSHAEAVPGGADDAAVSACAKASNKPSLKPVS